MIIRAALAKWTGITLVCGGFSFLLGLVEIEGVLLKILSMLLGVFTIILILSAIESSTRYQAMRARNKTLSEALDVGILIRLSFSFIEPFLLSLVVLPVWPYIMPTLWLGKISTKRLELLTGLEIDSHGIDGAIFVYLNTVTVALMHTLLLACLFGIIYAIKSCKTKKV